jgi:hypothetical protein
MGYRNRNGQSFCKIKDFGSEQILANQIEKGFVPILPLKEQGVIRSLIRRQVQKNFDRRLYRYRGVGESVFGSLKTRYPGRLRVLRSDMAKIAAMFLRLISSSCFARCL